MALVGTMFPGEMSSETNLSSSRRSATARALANVALVKYFGKRDIGMNLPAASSLSVTLEPLVTRTRVSFDPALQRDAVRFEGAVAGEKFTKRVSRFLNIVREMTGTDERAEVDTENSFPTAAGLASSASGFAALAVAATGALGMDMDRSSLSALARRGSGSAARSIPGGVCVWHRGEKPDGSDSFAESIAGPEAFDLRLVVGVTDPGPKKLGSTEAMEQTRRTSAYYGDWIRVAEQDMALAIQAVKVRNLDALGEVAEGNALAMHAAALAARPGILYWNGTTVEAIHLCRRLREDGLSAYFTCDAGPQPKILCGPADEPQVAQALAELSGVTRIIRCRAGGGAGLEG